MLDVLVRHRARGGRSVGRLASPLLVVTLACVLLATGCSGQSQNGDELQVVANPVAAQPAASPAPATEPAGTVFAAGHPVTAMATEATTRTLAVATTNPARVLLYSMDDPRRPPRSITVAGDVERLTANSGVLLASIPSRDRLARISPADGAITPLAVPGQPAAAVQRGDQTLVAARDHKTVQVFEGGAPVKTIAGQLESADDVLNAGGQPVVLDRLRSAVFGIDLARGTVSAGLRAGQGAANATVDSYGRVLVTDARGGALLAFSTDPLLLRQRYPVPGGIYGIAYDQGRALAWVTLTERNEVVGYDIRGGEPVEKHRFPTVRQPNSVTVDAQTSRVVVGSAAGEGIQVIKP